MRLRFFLCASADLGVRRSNVASSFCRSGYIEVSEDTQAGCCAAIRFPGDASRPGMDLSTLLLPLKIKLQSNLHQARISDLLGYAEVGAVGDVAVYVVEMGVIGNVEDIPTELKVLALADRDFLLQGHIPVVQADSAADSAARSAEVAESRIGKT